jgi:hypothetical protein
MTVVTEEEANTQWCPHGVGNSSNRVEGCTFFCVASRCMAWRWVKGSEKASVGRGYCGLAGRP